MPQTRPVGDRQTPRQWLSDDGARHQPWLQRSGLVGRYGPVYRASLDHPGAMNGTRLYLTAGTRAPGASSALTVRAQHAHRARVNRDWKPRPKHWPGSRVYADSRRVLARGRVPGLFCRHRRAELAQRARTDILATLPGSRALGRQHPGPQPASKIVKDARGRPGEPHNDGSIWRTCRTNLKGVLSELRTFKSVRTGT